MFRLFGLRHERALYPKVIRLWAGLLCALCVLRVSPTHAQTGITIINAPAPQYTFGEAVTFQITAASTGDITLATLFYRPLNSDNTVVNDAEIEPAPSVTALYSIDLAAHPLTPFTTLEYWWTVEDATGAQLTTEPQIFYYEDNRFAWQTLTREVVTVHWYQGDIAFGQAALDSAVAALADISAELQVTPSEAVNIYVYADDDEIRSALSLIGKPWVSGHADPTLGVVLVPIPPSEDAGTRLAREIPHELTHLLVYQAVGGEAGYRRLPAWLNEGLAVVNQTRPNPDAPALLATASKTGELLPLKNLCGPFPADPRFTELAYAESESVVRFIREEFGTTKVAALLAAYADGASCESGVERGLGVTLTELERRWLEKVILVNPATLQAQTIWPWIILTILVLTALTMVLWIMLRPRSKPALASKPK